MWANGGEESLTMKAQLYIKPNVIGLCFDTPHSRDLFLLTLKHKKVDACAELFGERSLRFNPAKATHVFNVGVDVGLHGNGVVNVFVEGGDEKKQPEPVKVVAAPVAPPKPPEQPVPAASIRPPEPVSPIGSLPPEITGQEIAAPPAPEVVQPPQPPPQIPIPQISQVTVDEKTEAVADPDPKPVGVHPLSKEMRQWRERQKLKQAKAAA